MFSVGAFGKINIDLLYGGVSRLPNSGDEIYSKTFDISLGGGFPATLINCKRLNLNTRLSTHLGDDIFSDFAKNQLQKTGIDYKIIPSKEYPINITSVAVTNENRTFLSYGGEEIYDDTICENIYESLKGSSVVLMQMGLFDVYKKLKDDGAILILDTGYDDKMTLQKYKSYMELADYYTPSFDEGKKLFNTDNKREIIKNLGEIMETPMLKLGGDGVAIFDGEYFEIPAIRQFKCVDSTGAGDAFLAGFCYGLSKNMSFRECVLAGNITGGKCVTKIGALSSYVTEKQIQEYIKENIYLTR